MTTVVDTIGPHTRRHDPAPAGFVHRMRVGWGDCDPARIAYTARIPEWSLAAIEAWWEHQVGTNWYDLQSERGFCTPFVHMRMDFRSPVTPRHPLDCEVAPSRLGHRSITLRVVARQAGVPCFEGEFVCVFVDYATMKPHAPPEDLAARIRAALPRDDHADRT